MAENGQLRGAADEILRGSLVATDADGDSLTFALEGGPQTGRVVIEEDGSFRYNPRGAYDELPTGEARVERFDFSVSDGQSGTDRGTVTLRLQGQYEPPAPPAEPDKPEWNSISGTSGFDVIEGTRGADLIRSGGGGYDRIWGDAGDDAFVFGSGASDGTRSSDQIFDFDPSEDILVLEAGADIAKTADRDGTLWLTLKGDGDVILLDGVDADALDIQHSDGLWLG